MKKLNLNVILNTGRSLRQGELKDAKTSKAYFEAVAICEIDPQDMEKLKIKEGEPVLVKTKHGEVVVAAKKSSQAPHLGVIFIPLGPWANKLVDPRSEHTGMPLFKGIPATIASAPSAKIPNAREVIEQMIK